jgi:glycosyltransferase involved in cell wall biosynthesis
MSELLSVVIPTHDRPDALARAARSVLAQQDPGPLEVVIVDDASGAATAAVIDGLRRDDRRVVSVRNDEALGPMRARNVGLALAGGELVGFCDDDDEWLPEAARTVAGHLRADRSVGLASSWHVVAHESSGRDVPFRGPLAYDHRHLLWQNVIGLPFGVLRREAFTFDISFDPEMVTGEDWDLWLRCAFERPVVTLPALGYRYVQHGGSRVTRKVDAQIAGRRHFVDKHGHAMSPACRMYHETVLVDLAHGRRAAAAHLATRAPGAPLAAATVGGVLLTGTLASRRGIRRGDPGLPARRMAAFVDRQRAPGTSS